MLMQFLPVSGCDHFRLLLFKRGQFWASNTVDISPGRLIFLIYICIVDCVNWLNADHLLIHLVVISHVAQTLSFCCSIVFLASTISLADGCTMHCIEYCNEHPHVPPKGNEKKLFYKGSLPIRKTVKKSGQCPLRATPPPPKRVKSGHLLSEKSA